MPHKVYVMLGFHASFYHSWRGDTPDEAGFGTDIRIVREIIRLLDEAHDQGLDARGYWDFDVYWTLEQIIPQHAPDIIASIRRRVQAGFDEVLPGPYNNGANHAATEEEFRTALAYALENPYGCGLRQFFGRVAPLYRPQEGMWTVGQNRILLEEGLRGIVNYYSSIPFNALSTFVPPLPPEQRYGALWLRMAPDEEPIVLLPCVSPGDVVNHISLEKWLLELRALQTSGRVCCDLLLHINFDADSDTWLPLSIPKPFAWFPNSGGLREYIAAVNKYAWAEFAVPSQYLAGHPPHGELLVRQDLADGAYDGSTSWAEKFTSLHNWTLLERSRLHSCRAAALAGRVPEPLAAQIPRRLWGGPESSFFRRLIGLSTTHFGMSTPVIHEERQAQAEAVLGAALQSALAAERDAALSIGDQATITSDTLYEFEVYNYARSGCAPAEFPSAPAGLPSPAGRPQTATSTTSYSDLPLLAGVVVRLPLLLPPGVEAVTLCDAAGAAVPASLVNVQVFPDATRAAELLFAADLGPRERRTYQMHVGIPNRRSDFSQTTVGHGDFSRSSTGGVDCTSGQTTTLRNRWLELTLSDPLGVGAFRFRGREIGGDDFLRPFVTYRCGRRPQRWEPSAYRFEDLADETWQGLTRACLSAEVDMDTPHGRRSSHFCYTFTLFDDLPYLLLDVEANYAYTAPEDVIYTIQQKLRRLLDLRWIEVAPCQITPCLVAPAGKPLRVWKHNYLGRTSYYDLDYGRINPRNRCLEAFNHQVTAGWVAVSDGQCGLLLAESAEALASMAFCPMRLHECKGVQHLSLNPFGSYYGKQPDYAHLGGNGLGAELATQVSGALRPNAPSFNGQNVRFSLLLAPYAGDEPPVELQQAADIFFYPCGVIYLQTPTDIDAVLPDDMRGLIAAQQRQARLLSSAPLPPPTAFLTSPSEGAAELVWDPPRDQRVSGYEVRWRPAPPIGVCSKGIVRSPLLAPIRHSWQRLFAPTAAQSGADSPVCRLGRLESLFHNILCSTRYEAEESTRWQTEIIPPGHRAHIPDLVNGTPYRFQVRALAGGEPSPWTAEEECVPGPLPTVPLFSAASGISLKTMLKIVYYGLVHGVTTSIAGRRWGRG